MFNHQNDERFVFMMGALAESFGQECSDFRVAVYAKALADVPIEAVEEAAWALIQCRTLSSFPKVGEIREYLHGGRADERSVMALDCLEKAMSSVGKYRSVAFEDAIITAVVSSMGGWPKLCGMEADEWRWARKEFEKIYRVYSTKSLSQLQIPEHLSGIAERDNSSKGLKDSSEAVVFIGDSKRLHDTPRLSAL
jgi:hypothetical protein